MDCTRRRMHSVSFDESHLESWEICHLGRTLNRQQEKHSMYVHATWSLVIIIREGVSFRKRHTLRPKSPSQIGGLCPIFPLDIPDASADGNLENRAVLRLRRKDERRGDIVHSFKVLGRPVTGQDIKQTQHSLYDLLEWILRGWLTVNRRGDKTCFRKSPFPS